MATAQPSSWPVGGGEMGALIRAHDWASTPLGPVACWPQSLKTAVDLCLGSAFASFVWWGPDLVQLYNDPALAMVNGKHPANVGVPARDAWEDIWGDVGPLVERVIGSGEAVLREDLPMALNRDGAREPATCTVSYSALRDEAGDVAGLFVTAIEVTQRIRAEEALRESEAKLTADLADTQELQRISGSLVRDDDIDALYERFTDAARSLMRSDMASLQMLVPERQALFLLAQLGFAPESATFWEWVQADDTTSCGLAFSRGEAVAVPDVEQWDVVAGTKDLQQYRLSRIRAMLSMPLISRGGRLVGVVSTHWSEVHQPSEREMRLLDVLARQAADLIERRTAKESLRASEAKYRALFDSIDEGFCTIEVIFDDNSRPVDYRFLDVNPAFERQTGIENAVGRRMREIAPLHEQYWFDSYGRVALTGEPLRFEQRAEQLGRVYDVYAFRMGVPAEHQVGILFSDITERTRAEQRLRESEERQAFLLKLSDALRPLSDALEIQRAAMHVLGEHLAADRVLYGEIVDGGRTILIADNYMRGDAPKLVGRFAANDFGTASAALRAGHTFVSADTGSDERMPVAEREALRRAKHLSILIVPLVKNSRWVSHLGAYQFEPREWTADEIRLVEETAERTWAAVERARAEEVLHANRAMLQSFYDTAPFLMGIGEIDGDTLIAVSANRMTAEFFGRQATDIPGKSGSALGTPAAIEALWLEQLRTSQREGRPVRFEYQEARVMHEPWLSATVAIIGRGATGRPQYSFIAEDITQRKLAEEARQRLAVIEAVAAERQALLRRVVHAQEEERRHLSHDIHDSVTQLAHAAALRLDDLAERLAPALLAEDQRDLERARDLARSAAVEARRLIAGLRPEMLDQFGLANAVRAELESLRRDGWTCTFRNSGLARVRFREDVEITLYRVAQEALTNVRKHAGRVSVHVGLWRRNGRIRLTVRDRGRGFDPTIGRGDEDPSRHVGLISMRERVELMGGRFTLQSTPGSGTRIEVDLPIQPADETGAGSD
jgi:PAS domain S-box-containing protein